MKTIEQIAAEILVDCGYVTDIARLLSEGHEPMLEPFSDTLEGRRQADALEDWLADEIDQKATALWEKSADLAFQANTHHEHRLQRIKYCLDWLRNK